MGVSGQLHSLAVVLTGKGPLTHNKQVNRRADLDVLKERKIPGPSQD